MHLPRKFITGRSRGVALGTLAVLALVPAAALARPGWRVSRFVAGSSFTGRSTASRCGASKFGKYTIHGDGTIQAHGRQSLHEVVTLSLVNDHKRHAFHLVSLKSSAFNGVSAKERRAVIQMVAKALRRDQVEIVAVNGNTLTLQTFTRGKPAAVAQVPLKRVKHC
ncbi:MAG: hypothetical protein M3Z27_00015 [Actinomycetota bacterium]|nr:hypothetical protein [Actinomycetota bacterium]